MLATIPSEALGAYVFLSQRT